MKSRPYKVTHKKTGTVRLIEGQHIAQVARYIATDYDIAPMKAMDAAKLVALGTVIESACGGAAK